MKRGNREGTLNWQPASGRRHYGRWTGQVLLTGIGRLAVAGRKGESKASVRERLHAKRDEYAGIARPAAGSLAEWLADWHRLYTRDLAPRTRESYADEVRRHLVPHLGDRPLAKLSADEVVVALGKIERPASRRYAYTVLRIALGRAVKTGRIARNVATMVDPPRVTYRTVEPPTAAEVAAILSVLRGQRDEALILTALSTGLRQGELVGLRWMDLEVSSGRLDAPAWAGVAPDVRGGQVPYGGVPGVPGHIVAGGVVGSAVIRVRGQLDRNRQYVGAKRGSERTVAATPVVLAALAAHRQRVTLARGYAPEVGNGHDDRSSRGSGAEARPNELPQRDHGPQPDGPLPRRRRVRVGDGGQAGVPTGRDERGAAGAGSRSVRQSGLAPERDYIWTDAHGQPMTGYEAYRRWQVACREAGVRAMPFHAARHFANTALVEAGMPEQMVRAVIGHRNAAMTERYVHKTGEATQRAADIMDRALGG